jgi:hypothetical protein
MIQAQPTPFIFHCRERIARRNVMTRSPHTPELEFLSVHKELIPRVSFTRIHYCKLPEIRGIQRFLGFFHIQRGQKSKARQPVWKIAQSRRPVWKITSQRWPVWKSNQQVSRCGKPLRRGSRCGKPLEQAIQPTIFPIVTVFLGWTRAPFFLSTPARSPHYFPHRPARTLCFPHWLACHIRFPHRPARNRGFKHPLLG